MKLSFTIIILAIGLLGFTLYRTIQPATTGTGTVCTADAKLCPDGSYVSRVPPNCEFQECPQVKVDEINLEYITPNKGEVGQKVTLKGTGFGPEGENVVKFGIGYIYDPVLVDRTTLEFLVPEGHELCAPGQEVCPGAYPRVEPGVYEVKVLVDGAESNVLEFEVL